MNDILKRRKILSICRFIYILNVIQSYRCELHPRNYNQQTTFEQRKRNYNILSKFYTFLPYKKTLQRNTKQTTND